jgi:hypothetical protein
MDKKEQQTPDWAAELVKLVKNFDTLKDTVEGLEEFAEAMGNAGEGFNQALDAIQAEQERLASQHLLLDWKISKVLSALEPERFPDPGPPPDDAAPPESGPQEGTEESTDQPVG